MIPTSTSLHVSETQHTQLLRSHRLLGALISDRLTDTIEVRNCLSCFYLIINKINSSTPERQCPNVKTNDGLTWSGTGCSIASLYPYGNSGCQRVNV